MLKPAGVTLTPLLVARDFSLAGGQPEEHDGSIAPHCYIHIATIWRPAELKRRMGPQRAPLGRPWKSAAYNRRGCLGNLPAEVSKRIVGKPEVGRLMPRLWSRRSLSAPSNF